ncbi:Hypothetical protein R9X50_00178700 [Acrodontium crateriforme]|uniref:Cytochrome b5 heme-binding domain-containing protein n=1 Tax=Acrodontium crateriforme TaxID=150365 RepID=A0AAQ3R314_9PEZI|nr:Hypothetical protein R9X50_00178700 [Acrodontium crateriforme]
MSEIRQRKPHEASKPTQSTLSKAPQSQGSSRLGLKLFLGLGAISLAGVAFLKPELLGTQLTSLLSTNNELVLTESQLKAYTGADPNKPIYLAIDGVIYDVSSSPRFYGPGGHYNHFTGRDASRGWVTECWGSEDQLVHNMDGVEAMYMPRYMDEELQKYADTGEVDEYAKERQGLDAVLPQAENILKIIGRVTQEEIDRRRAEDLIEAKAAVRARLEHWIGFFSGSEKYKIAGKVRLDPPKFSPVPCEAALMKRPMKPGKIEAAGAEIAKNLAAQKKQ